MCTWTEEEVNGDTWNSSCGHAFCITDGTPLENDMNFCCFCGEKLDEQQAVEDEDEDEAEEKA